MGGGLKCILLVPNLNPRYAVVKAKQVFGSQRKMNCFCYRYPGSCLSEKSSIHSCNICKILYLLTFYIFKNDLP